MSKSTFGESCAVQCAALRPLASLCRSLQRYRNVYRDSRVLSTCENSVIKYHTMLSGWGQCIHDQVCPWSFSLDALWWVLIECFLGQGMLAEQV